MSYRMIDALVTTHTQEVRRQAARCSGHRRAPRSSAAALGPAPTKSEPELRHPTGLRTRIGFALIEAGLRLSAGGRLHQKA